jgi:hypothetical protein
LETTQYRQGLVGGGNLSKLKIGRTSQEVVSGKPRQDSRFHMRHSSHFPLACVVINILSDKVLMGDGPSASFLAACQNLPFFLFPLLLCFPAFFSVDVAFFAEQGCGKSQKEWYG